MDCQVERVGGCITHLFLLRVSSAQQHGFVFTSLSSAPLMFPVYSDNAALIHLCVKCISCLLLHFKLEFLFQA